MRYNINSGYGQLNAHAFLPAAPNGRTFIVGAATIENIQIAQDIFKHDPDGNIRMFTTLASAVAAVYQDKVFSTTPATSGSTFTNSPATAAPGQLVQTGDKVILSGTTAPTNFTLGTVYYAINANASTFQLSLQRSGTAITVGSTGTAVTAVSLGISLDTIYIMPSHNENVSSATALNINVGGIRIVGLGIDETRPTFYLDTATTTTITVSAPAITWSNCIFDFTGFAAIVTGFTIKASDVQFDSCKFITGNSTNQVGVGITTTLLCDRFKFTNNRVIGSTDAGTTNFLQLIGGNDIEISGNYFFGAYTTSLGPVNNITTACLRMKISDNIMINATASATKVVVLLSTSTGMISNNRVGIGSGAAPFTAAAGWWAGNWSAAAVSTNGTLV